jgi:hypothetical protein
MKRSMKFKSKIVALALGAIVAAPWVASAHAGDSTASVRASENFSAASGKIVSGSVGLLAASGELIVVGVEQSAHGISVALKSSADVSGEVLTVLVDGVAAASVAVGHGVQASATGVGHALVASGKMIAFIPNEIGQSLIHHSRYSR